MLKHRNHSSAKYKRVVLKLSGEAFAVDNECLGADSLNNMAQQIKSVKDLHVQVAIVVGGGNIFRGFAGEKAGTDRNTGDYMGMLATMINSLALRSALEDIDVPACVMTAFDMPRVAELTTARKAIKKLEDGYVVILGGGTGNPYCTTDSAAALRATEIQADAVLKGTKVDGIYSADPKIDTSAKLYNQLTYSQALEERLKVMDAGAFALCMENNIPIVVFNYFKEGEILKVIRGESVGTLVASNN